MAWASSNQNLPAYVVLTDPAACRSTTFAIGRAGWLPAAYQGTPFRPGNRPVAESGSRPRASLPKLARRSLQFLEELNAIICGSIPAIPSWKPASQISKSPRACKPPCPTCSICRKRTDATKKLYGLDNPTTAEYGTRCLIARRLVERGVRFVQLFLVRPALGHAQQERRHAEGPVRQDRPTQRRVGAGPEAARLAGSNDRHVGRRIRPPADFAGHRRPRPQSARQFDLARRRRIQDAATATAAPTTSVTRPSRTRSHVHDLHATLLHALGLDHKRLTFPHDGRPSSLDRCCDHEGQEQCLNCLVDSIDQCLAAR